MKHYFRFAITVASIAMLAMLNSSTFAQTAPTIAYQGIIENNGSPINGTDTMKILIYNTQSGRNPLFTETQPVTINNGLFNVSIGSVTPLLPALDFRSQYYLAVSINGGPESSPRSLVSFAPYAFRALIADTASYATAITGNLVGSVNGKSGALIIAGNKGISVTDTGSKITIGSVGVQSIDSLSGVVSLVGSGGTKISYSGNTINVNSPPQGVSTLRDTDGCITVVNPTGPTTTIVLAKQNAETGQVL